MLIDRWSIDLAPAGTYTNKEYDWKYNHYSKPAKDQKIQVLENDRWYDATILKTEENVVDENGLAASRPVLTVACGFRIYCDGEKSDKTDENQRPYKGYSKVVNLPLFDPSIRLFPDSRNREYTPAENNREAADGAAAGPADAVGDEDEEGEQ